MAKYGSKQSTNVWRKTCLCSCNFCWNFRRDVSLNDVNEQMLDECSGEGTLLVKFITHLLIYIAEKIAPEISVKMQVVFQDPIALKAQ